MTNVHNFRPEWLSPPGDTIQDILEEKTLSVDWLAKVLNRPIDVAVDLINGKHRITKDIAERLSDCIGSTPSFWISRDQFYLNCLKDREEIVESIENGLPYGQMSEYNWLPQENNRDHRLKNVLDFFEVPNIIRWDREYGRIRQHYAFRTSKSFDSNPVAVAAWLKRAEKEADSIECLPWNPESLHQNIQQFRILTKQKDPQVFLPKLRALCANHGIAFVVIPRLLGCTASGATKTNVNGKALIAMSARHLSDDHFWFTFFHEIAHLLLHRNLTEFIDFSMGDQDNENMKIEDEANEFAKNVLIPANYYEELRKLRPNHREVIRFASRVGVSPGIVVGQLQHLGIIRHNWLNFLKRRYKWEGTQLYLS